MTHSASPPTPFGATSHSLSIRPAVSHTGSFSIAIAEYAVPFAIRLNAQLPVPDFHCLVIELPWRAKHHQTPIHPCFRVVCRDEKGINLKDDLAGQEQYRSPGPALTTFFITSYL